MEKRNYTIGQLLTSRAVETGENRAVIYAPKKYYNFQELDEMACKAARGLLAIGVSRGESVAVWAPNILEWLFILFGCAKIGAVAVPVNFNCGMYELEYILKQSDASVLFWADSIGRTDECAVRELQSSSLPMLRNVVFLGTDQYSDMLSWSNFLQKAADVDDAALSAREMTIRLDDIFIIQYSSGTTGFPKGAMLTHSSYVLNAIAIAERKKHIPQDIICVLSPFYSSYGFLSMLVTVAAGAAALVAERFVAREMLQMMEDWRATAIYGTPTNFLAMLEILDHHQYDLIFLRGGSISGDYCPPEIAKRIVEKIGTAELGIQYGSTETLVTVMNWPEEPLEKRIGTIGQAMPDTVVRIVDPQTGLEMEKGRYGELCVKGPSVMKGYYKSPELTARTIDPEGWLHSGDLACADGDGYYRIMGRIKDVIIRGGENIYPAEIEVFLMTHPKVNDVKVVGIPSSYYGEEAVAFVRLKPGQTATALEFKSFCRRQIAINKVPVQFFFVDQYPETSSSKVQKYRLRELAVQLLRT